VDAGWFFDEELVKLRWEWVSAVDPRTGRGDERGHVAARAYFERAAQLQHA
jgi:hypothetical protein